ncbi:Sec23-binding domain of Sec16-domain-containing protein [Rhodofomes roseus]|uniref:Protein transport protein sec16 n=1 Tax=Rhodofomes roseus TaxID=34475 RepID=A0ABQ8KU72_9APHY|nr:Sec23-binding domain of Sec16-domain-containing protein [Rhodofomes roseus]KAH9842630.1 Sec23-binding domain of Sec16-domain-containing protein [Rhodofomes roseus]
MPRSTVPPFPPNPIGSPSLPAAVPHQTPVSSVLPSEEELAGVEPGPDPYVPRHTSGPSASPPTVNGNHVSHGPSPYELPRVASPSQRGASPWTTGSARLYGSTTSPTDYAGAYSPAHSAPERTKSPGSASVRSVQSVQRQQVEKPYQGSLPKSPPKPPRTSPPTRVSPNAYDPPPIPDARRAVSPSTMPSRPSSVVSGGYDPYAPAANNRMRSMSNGSVLSSISAILEDPYTPSRHTRQQTSDSMNSSFEPAPTNAYASHASTVHDSPAQVLTVPYPAQTMYAPSPSLVGANDPLGRTSVRVPVISFGFGGKLVTCFHGSSEGGGFDVALASRQSSEVKLHTLHNVIPDSALDTSAASYPGPLFSDPGTPTTSLVRTATSTQTKTKKARIVKYLEERAEELNRGLGYFHSDSLEGRRAEGKHILVKLLRVMVENDGRLSGSPHVDAAVRSALTPRAAQPASDALQLAASLSGDLQSPNLAAVSPFLSLTASQDPSDAVIATHTLQSSHLDKIQEFLLRGDRRAASHYASDQKLWAHAMVIASSIDKDAWKEVVTEFVRTELASKPQAPGTQAKAATDGREALRVAYSLFAGHGPASIQELLTPKPFAPTASTLQVPLPSTSSITPVSASFPGPSEPMNIPSDVLAKWADTVAMIYSSPITFETSSALTALGDQLVANHWYEAAHACYLLSPQTSPMGGIGSSSRMVLLGSPSPSVSMNFAKNPDPLIFSEVAEFALSLTPPAKGQDAFAGLPHLQPYRLIRAASLAEMGHMQLANRYCEAISNCLNKNSPYINPTFLEQLRGLNDRLVAAPHLDKSGSWITSKVSKPSLDGIGSWVGGRLTKFIAGEDSPGPDQQTHRQPQQPFSGPFSQYSTISSTTSSAVPSPHQSTVNLAQIAGSPPPFRTGSAMGLRAPAAPQINRASSAMDYTRPSLSRKSSPVPRVASANPATTTFADASLYSQALNVHAFGSSSKQSLNGYGTHDDQSADGDSPQSNGPALGSWWGASDASAATPTASSFMQNDESSVPTATSGQFMSLMDDYSATPTAYQAQRSFSDDPRASIEEEDEDDLGLGNSFSRAKRRASEGEQTSESVPAPSKEVPKEEANSAKAEEKPAASPGGWLSRLWKRESTPAPVRANLGQETSFYYDKELKRWVNKTGGAEATKPAQPPPPPRAQTASPGTSMRALPSGTTPPPPPPARPATTDPGDGMPKPPMRIRSNLVPPESDSSAPPTPMSATLPGQGPPPASRSRGAAKRPARSRYVDVFAQQQGS